MDDLPAHSVRHYFVDEAGDGTIFGSKGEILIGQEGCSRYFTLGLLVVQEPEQLAKDLTQLRERLINDPYFRGVPSIQPESRKTAIAFHAKDDLPEIRREVYSLLQKHQLKFFAVIRDKLKVLEYIRQRNEREPLYRYNPNELYDALVRRLFKDRLHQHDRYNVIFSRRGHSDRTKAFAEALLAAKERFRRQWGKKVDSEIEVVASNSRLTPELQAVDYFLWALQRFYEKREERYLTYIWSQVSLIHDVDDTRSADYGCYYTRKNPLTLKIFEEERSGI